MAKSRKSSAGGPPISGVARLEGSTLEAFGAIVNPKASSLLGTIRCVSHFAAQVPSEPQPRIMVGRLALLLGLLEFGLAEPPKYSSSGWMMRWMIDELGLGPKQWDQILARHENSGANARFLARGATVVLSPSINALLPEALKLAQQTVKRSVIDLRHLIFALLRSPGDEWDILPKRPTAGQFAYLRQQIVDEIVAHPEDGENVGAWKALLPAEGGSDVVMPWSDERIERLKSLWSQGVTASQIADELGGISRNAVMGKAHRLGLQSRPSPVEAAEEPEAGSVSVEPGGTLFMDARALEQMRDTFRARFPDFEERGFDANEGSYWEVERAYKQELIDDAARFLDKADRAPETIGLGLLDILRSEPSNLLDWREQRRIREVEAEAPQLIERALGEMVLSTLPPSESVARCVEQIAEAYLKGQEGNRPFAHLRTLPTMALALAKPAEAIAVRYTAMHRASVRLTGGSLFRNAPMSAQEYATVLAIAHHIEKVMRDAWGWRPRDLWDVQGFLWVATETDKTPVRDDDGFGEIVGDTSVQDRYRTQADDPAIVDALERGPFAAVLAARILEIRNSARTDEPEGDRAFMVHLHGPWGSGKSSILNLLRRELEHPKEGEPSLVVMFNAWKQQRMRPPWWALMNAIYRGAIDRCGRSEQRQTRRGERFSLWKLWWLWRWKAEMLPVLLVGLLLGALTFALWGTETRGLVETAGKIGVAAVAGLAGVYAYARLMIFGSQKAVQTYADLTTDPYRRIVDLFNRLVAEIKLPLVVFIDDLDRCDSDYVVELLEGIQTLFRHAPVTYVVAADRKWICSSFEKKYSDFAGSIGEPCRPLGYLFLDKLFQISAEMPRLTREVQAGYLAALLREELSEGTKIDDELMAEAEERVSGISNEADLQQLIADEEAQVVPEGQQQESLGRQRALRAAAALQITSAEATRETEHRLQKLSHLLEPNPRSMKRLVNAVGMAQARGILEGRSASPETRARWAMLSLRWPILAEFIADNPAAIAHWRKPEKTKSRRMAKPDPAWPEAVRALHGNATVMETVGAEGEEGALTPDALAPLLT